MNLPDQRNIKWDRKKIKTVVEQHYYQSFPWEFTGFSKEVLSKHHAQKPSKFSLSYLCCNLLSFIDFCPRDKVLQPKSEISNEYKMVQMDT